MLTKIKKRCGIAESITVHDDEITSLIEAAKIDMKQAGVKSLVILRAYDTVEQAKVEAMTDEEIKRQIKETNEQVLNCITCYVKAYRGNDRTDTDKYLKLYKDNRTTLSLEDAIGEVIEDVV